MKTINNMLNSTRKEVVIDALSNHCETLYKLLKELVETEINYSDDNLDKDVAKIFNEVFD